MADDIKLCDDWNGLTGSQLPQQFVDEYRQQGIMTIEEMAAEYVQHLEEMFPAYTDEEEWTPEHVEDARRTLITYLETRHDEWQ